MLGSQGQPSGPHPPALHHPVLSSLAQAAGLGEGAQQGDGSEGGGGGGPF